MTSTDLDVTGVDFDVVVVGGGTSGAVAAIQAARAGVRTLLVERYGTLGGTTTMAGVALPGLFHAWGQQVIGGIGWDLVTACVELERGRLPDFTAYQLPHYRLQVPVNPFLYASLLAEETDRSGVSARLHTMIADVEWRDDHWQLSLCGKEGLSSVTTHRIVDASGDADVVGQAGLPRVKNARRQPGTIMCQLSGYDLDQLDFALLNDLYDSAVAAGRLRPSDFATSADPVRKFLRAHGSNSIHVLSESGETSAGRTANELEARRVLLRIVRFLRELPGLEHLRVDFVAPECGIRESVTIVGRSTITVEDYVSGRLFDDAVCYSFYPVDVHSPDGNGIDIRPLSPGVVPTIPRRAMLPADHDFICVAGRSVAGDQEANSAYRVQATSMATGQAAGALAALSVRLACGLSQVPQPALSELLTAHGAIVPSTAFSTFIAAATVAANSATDHSGSSTDTRPSPLTREGVLHP